MEDSKPGAMSHEYMRPRGPEPGGNESRRRFIDRRVNPPSPTLLVSTKESASLMPSYLSGGGRMPQLEAVVFDNNGTMLDDLSVAYGSVEAIFSVLNLLCPTRDQYREEIGSKFMEFYRRHGVTEHITAEQLNVIRKLYYGAHMNQAHFRPDLVPALHHCSRLGLRLAVCSAEIRSVLKSFLDRDGIAWHFDVIRAEAWPKGEALRGVVDAMGMKPERAAYVDDTEDGIISAREAGLRTIAFAHPTGYNSAERLRNQKPDYVVNDFGELRSLLSGLTI